MCHQCCVVYYGVGWTKDAFGDAATPIVTVALLIAYVALARVSAKYAAEGGMDINAELTEAIVIQAQPLSLVYISYCLSWFLFGVTVERFSPGLSAFWATVFMIFILITQRPLMT